MAALRCHRLIYGKKSYSGLTGDCGTQTSLGANIPGFISQGSGIVGSSLGLASSFGASIPALLGPLTAGIGLLALPFVFLFAAHARAVAKEQGTICGVAVGWNDFMDAIEQALAQGKIGLQDAQTALKKVREQAQSQLDSVARTDPYCNAGCGFKYAVDALYLQASEKTFPALVPGSALSSLTSGSGLGIAALAGAGLLLVKSA